MNSGQVLKPSRKLMTKYHVSTWVIFLLSVFPFVFLGYVPELGWLYVGIFLACCAVGIVVVYVLIPPYYRSISYELGPEEIIVQKGIITKVQTVVPYRMVTNVSVKRGILDRWMGLGTLDVHTAGFSQQTTPEAKLAGLEDHERVHQAVMASLRRFRDGAGVTAPEVSTVPAEAKGSITGLLQEILDEVKALRAAQR